MRLLITGAGGFIGRAAVRYFRTDGWDVLGVDLRARSFSGRVDVGDRRAVDRTIRRFDPDGVLHLAAYASVPGCEADPARCVRENVLGTVNVAQAASRAGARLVFASTAAVYGDATPVPMSLGSTLRPTNLYGMSKLTGEHVVRVYAPDSVSLRLFNVYGEGCERSYVIPDIIRKLARRPSVLRLDGTGREARDFVYLDDVLRAMRASLRGRFRGPFNVGTGVLTSVRSLALHIAREMGLRRVQLAFSGPRPGDFRVTLADISGRNAVPRWGPTISLADGLRRVISAG